MEHTHTQTKPKQSKENKYKRVTCEQRRQKWYRSIKNKISWNINLKIKPKLCDNWGVKQRKQNGLRNMAEKIEKPSYVEEYKKDFYVLKNNHSRKRTIWKTNKQNKQTKYPHSTAKCQCRGRII